VKVIDLARNYQHLKAMIVGLDYASGDLVFLIDVDLEEKPELLGEFYQCFHEHDVDIVYGVQDRRKGGVLERLTGALFYKVINFFSSVRIAENMVTTRFMRRRYVRAVVAHRERELYLGGIWTIAGFRQLAKVVSKDSSSQSTYTLRLKVRDAVNGILSFSDKPLVYVFYTGCLMMVATIPYVIYVLGARLFFAHVPDGWTSLIVSMWFLGGLNIFMLGIVGIYVSKIFIETKQRPYAIIRELYGFGPLDTPSTALQSASDLCAYNSRIAHSEMQELY
jgi:putative glycosyltransferase